METCKSEFFRINDNNRIGREKIYPIFYNGSREENIIFSFFECVNSVFNLIPRHLTMSNDNFRFFSYFSYLSYRLDFFRKTFHSSDSIMENDNLSFSFHFGLNSSQDYFFIPSSNDCFDRFFLFWWSCNDGYFFES